MNKEDVAYVKRQLLTILIIVILALILFAFGLMIGYSVVGNGKNPWAILHIDKWRELLSKFTGK